MDLIDFLWNYHIGEETNFEHSFFKDLVKKLYAQYPKLKGNLKVFFDKEGKDYSEREREEIVYKISKSIFRNYAITLESLNFKKIDFNHMLKIIKRDITECLPFYLENDETFYSNRGFITEPIVIYCYYIISSIQKEVSLKEKKGIGTEEEKMFLYTFNNILRSIKSSLILFAIGDDVHGIAVTRGAIELICRFSAFNDENIKEALYFSHLNDLLQKYKSSSDKEKKMDPELKEFLKNHGLTVRSAEMYLLNGWIKHENGNQVTSNSKLFDVVLKDDAEVFKSMYHTCSEFVHEDYALANYDFISLREQFKLSLAFILYTCKEVCGGLDIKVKGWNQLERFITAFK